MNSKLAVTALSLSFLLMPVAPAISADTFVDINVSVEHEKTGLELGEHAYARGDGSIATGKNSLAIGKNAVATGGNETKETIEQKLAENAAKLNEIEQKKQDVTHLTDDLNNLKVREHDVIEAGIRVEQIRKAKENARGVWNDAEQAWQTKVNGTAAELQEYQNKLDDLNSRLTGVSKLTHTDITSPEGLTAAATELKGIVEQGTSLNLSTDFYKDYVSTYYAALGDLRKNEVTYSKLRGSYSYNGDDNSYFKGLNVLAGNWNGYETFVGVKLFYCFGMRSNNPGYSGPSGSNISFYDHSIYDMQNSGLKEIVSSNITTDLTTQADFDYWNANKDTYKAHYIDYILNVADGIHRFGDDAEAAQALRDTYDMKFAIEDSAKKITYYQWQYEQTGSTTWLDKKKQEMKRREGLLEAYEKSSAPKIAFDFFSKKKDEFKAENIDAIKDKNKITTDTLTSELERELGINKNHIQEIQNEIARLRSMADQAKANYEGLNPSQQDLILAREYERVARELQKKAEELAAAVDKLKELQDSLTLHNLANTGENAIAYGTEALATGTDSIAFGTKALATASSAIALGKNSVVSGEEAVGIGAGNTVSGKQSVALGTGNKVSGTNSVAVGTGHTIVGNNSGAFGDPNTVYGDNSYAFGNNNTIGSSASPHTTGTNTFVLGNNVTTSANNAVVLGNGSEGMDNAVSVGSAASPRKIVNVADGLVSSGSHDAVNGSQLYEAMQNAGEKYTAGYGITIRDNRIHDDINNVKYDADKNAVTLGKSVEKVGEKRRKITVTFNGGESKNGGEVKVYVNEQGKLEYVPNVTADSFKRKGYRFTGWDHEFDTDLKDVVFTCDTAITAQWVQLPPWEYDPNENEPDFSLSSLIGQPGTDPNPKGDNPEDYFPPIVTREKLPGTVKITNLTSGDISDSSTDAINGSQLWKLSNSPATAAGWNKTAWQEALGDGKVEAGNKGLVNGDTVNTAINTVKNDLNTGLNGKADVNAGNITGENKTAWQEKLGDGKVEADNKGLVNGDTVNTAINTVKNDLNTGLKGKADVNAGNITGENKTAWQEKLGDGKVEADNKGLVSGGTVYNAINTVNENVNTALDGKANTDLNNITENGKTVIKNLAKGSVKVAAGTNVTVGAHDENGATVYTVSAVTGSVAAGDEGLVTGDEVNKALNDKADVNAGNITGENKTAWQEKLGDGKVEAGNKGLVSGSTVYNAFENLSNTTAHTSLDNLSEEGKNVISDIAGSSVKVVGGHNTTVTESTEGHVKIFTVNTDFDQDIVMKKSLTVQGLAKFENSVNIARDLTVRGNAAIDKDLTVKGNNEVYGDQKVHGNSYVGKNLNVVGNGVFGGSLVVNGPAVFRHGADMGGNVITSVADGRIAQDSTDAVNGGQLWKMNRDLTSEIRKSGSRAAALAGLHPLPYDPDKPTSVAAAWGNYRGENTLALGLQHYFSDDALLTVASTINHEPMLSASLSFRLGGSSSISTKKKASQKRQLALQDAKLARMETKLEELNQDKTAAELRYTKLLESNEKLTERLNLIESEKVKPLS